MLQYQAALDIKTEQPPHMILDRNLNLHVNTFEASKNLDILAIP
jgi:hypothetical protein